MSKFVVVSIKLLIIFSLLGWFGYITYNNFYGVPSNAPTGEYSFEVSEGQKLGDIAKKLESEKIIYSSSSLLLLEKADPILPLQTGKYTIKLNKTNPEEILKLINQETKKIAEEKAKNKTPTVSITFKEGLTVDDIIELLVKNNLSTKVDLLAFVNNIENFDRSVYTFLPEPLKCTYGNLKICSKYYIEGYFYPDTYQFFIDSTPKTIFKKFLDNFNTRVWQKVKDQVGDKDFQDVMIMASVLEKETGRTKGVTDANRDELSKERKVMAGVFYNRTAEKMKWQSDVTAEYGTGGKLCQQTFKIPNCIYIDSPQALTKYNTYYELRPIGPVTNPQFDNIDAALNPDDNDYLFFVSDVVGKKYFAKTGSEHQKVIVQVNEINRKLGL